MRRRFLLYIMVICFPLLGGCGMLPGSYPRLEQLRIVQALGVDSAGSGLRLTLATAAGDASAKDAVCLSAEGPSLAAALSRAQSRSTEETLFCGHIRQLLVGEDVPLEPLLETVCRSADLRLDMPLYLLRGSSAEALMTGAGSGSRAITEVLNAVRGELDSRSDSRAYTAGQILQDLQRQGSALLFVLRSGTAAEHTEGADRARTALPAGFAVVKDGAVCSWLGTEALLGVSLLRNRFGVQELTIADRKGIPATLELRQGSSRVRPVWDEDGTLRGLDITVRFAASLLETGESPLSEPYIDDLTARLESAVSERLRVLLTRSKSLQADFLGLGPRVEAASPLAFRRLETPFPELLPKLEISLTVQSRILHEYDLQ